MKSKVLNYALFHDSFLASMLQQPDSVARFILFGGGILHDFTRRANAKNGAIHMIALIYSNPYSNTFRPLHSLLPEVSITFLVKVSLSDFSFFVAPTFSHEPSVMFGQ